MTITSFSQNKYKFRRQWVILRKNSDFYYKNWNNVVLSKDFVLYYHPDLNVRMINISEPKVKRIIILGILLVPHLDTLLESTNFIKKSLDIGNEIDDFCEFLSGSYVIVLCESESISIFTDPAALRGVYYSSYSVASTPLLISKNVERDKDLDSCFPFGSSDEWYPGDLTPYKNIRALMANHKLNLTTGVIERFWPKKSTQNISYSDALEKVSKILRNTLEYASKEWDLIVSLTGGKDTRVNLSASRNIKNSLHYFTIADKDLKNCDYVLSKRLADTFNLNHKVYPILRPEKWLLKLYDQNSSFMSIGKRREIVSTCNLLSGHNTVHVNGNLGAICKSFYWHRKKPKNVKIESLLKEFYNRPVKIKYAVNRWFQSLPDVSPITAYNLMYLEQRSRWMSPGETGSQLFYESLSPFNNRLILEIVSSINVNEFLKNDFLVSLVDFMWPELLDVSYCKNGRNWTKKIPKRLRERLKKNFR
ncbi:asparagine synthetase B family protein [Marispirochaeta aestuarii]|uniref:hypothetical protein n=1 Tax=Marispirochaeta aestuarii TaxID=1963862 RepID=UPI0011785C2B|nr:hypothetical protein [Marispirochaeta aestuarii]